MFLRGRTPIPLLMKRNRIMQTSRAPRSFFRIGTVRLSPDPHRYTRHERSISGSGEMTLRSLNASNACIVVVDATKGVTDADLGLFRVLRGVSTQRMILFINKIDLVQGTAEDARWVAKQIAASVFDELGSNKIPVIVGNAQQTNENDPDHSANGSTSGLTELEAALSSSIHHGHSAHYVHQAAATLTALADGVRSLAASQLAELQRQQQANTTQFDDQILSARAMAFKQDLVKQIERTTGSAVASLQEIGGIYEKRAVTNLRRLVEDYAASTRSEFLKQHPTCQQIQSGSMLQTCDEKFSQPIHMSVTTSGARSKILYGLPRPA
jgi:translation elongation factor EF-G